MAYDELPSPASWVIGRTEECDIRVPEPTVSGSHCRLTRKDDGFLLEDLGSSNGTFVDGARLVPHEPVFVPYGAKVTLGTHVPMPWPPSSALLRGRGHTVESFAPPAPRPASKPITIGRSPDSDIQLDLPIIGWNHAMILFENGQYILEDRNSRNGTSIGSLGNRIQRAALSPADQVFFGSYKISAEQLLARGKKLGIGESAFQSVSFPADKNQMEIGRDPGCDLPLDYPMISWRHARLTRDPAGILVEDLGSRNGTFVDGVRLSGKVLVKPGQEIGLGSFRFQLMGGGRLAQREYYGNVTIEANGIVVHAPNGKRLLDAVSLTVFPSELVALMGPAGAGKTTLLKALNGYTRPVEGKVLFNGYSLYDYYDSFRQQMGYVPQDDIVHPQLTVREALYFSARLRTDLSEAEIESRATKVLQDLGIADKIDTVIGSPERKTLSGGQRKRVNIALELITDTPVLFLDEPTSGLSSYDAESVVDLLKQLSKAGKTVVTTIHQPSLKVYKQFDDLLMVSRDQGDSPGALVFFGPAYPDSIQFFNAPSSDSASPAAADLNPEMLFSGMNTVAAAHRTESWRKRFRESKYYQDFVSGRSGKQPQTSGKTGEEKPRRVFGFTQWLALVRRNLIVKIRDRAQTAILLAQAPFFAALVCLIATPLDKSDFAGLAAKLLSAHFLMVVAAVWFGCNNAARDIVGEWTIYKRERMVTLKLIPYAFSKLFVLLALCVFQCGSMLAIVYFVCGLRSSFLLDFASLLTISLIGAALGLCISALARTNESAIALLPVVLLPFIALGGGMRPTFQLPPAGRAITWAIPSRWAFEANFLEEAKAGEWKLEKPAAPPAPLAGSASAPPCAPAAVPNPALTGDIAQQNLPSYVVDVSDDKGRHLRPALDSEYPDKNAKSNAQEYRHSYRFCISLLAGVLLMLVSAVILILRKRDGDLQ